MPEPLGDPLHVHFGGELRLRRAEAAERAVGRRVGHHRAAADADVDRSDTGRLAWITPRESTTALSVAYAPPSRQHVDVHRDQPAVARHAGAMADDRRMALGRRHHVLDAVVDRSSPAGPP